MYHSETSVYHTEFIVNLVDVVIPCLKIQHSRLSCLKQIKHGDIDVVEYLTTNK